MGEDEIGADVYGFASLFEAARDQSLPPPTSDRKPSSPTWKNTSTSRWSSSFKPHAIQVLTDDDEIELAYYLFDDHYLKSTSRPHRSYLLHEGWRLPTTSGDSPGETTCRNPGDPAARARIQA